MNQQVGHTQSCSRQSPPPQNLPPGLQLHSVHHHVQHQQLCVVPAAEQQPRLGACFLACSDTSMHLHAARCQLEKKPKDRLPMPHARVRPPDAPHPPAACALSFPSARPCHRNRGHHSPEGSPARRGRGRQLHRVRERHLGAGRQRGRQQLHRDAVHVRAGLRARAVLPALRPAAQRPCLVGRPCSGRPPSRPSRPRPQLRPRPRPRRSYNWTLACPGSTTQSFSGATPTIPIGAGGVPANSSCQLTLTVTDALGQTSNETTALTVAPVLPGDDCVRDPLTGNGGGTEFYMGGSPISNVHVSGECSTGR